MHAAVYSGAPGFFSEVFNSHEELCYVSGTPVKNN